MARIGGGGWISGLACAAIVGVSLGAFNAALIYYFRIVSIVVTIATFNIFFGMLMFLTRGVSIYNLPNWWIDRTVLFEFQQANGNWAELTLPVAIMAICVLATWILIRHTSTGRQLYAFGDNAEGARRLGINIGAMHFIAYGWQASWRHRGAVQVHYAQEVVPNALVGRELDVLAAVVLGGARLGGGQGDGSRLYLGVFLVSITQNGLNLLGISPYAFKMIVGAIILIAISLSSSPSHPVLGRIATTGASMTRSLPRSESPDRSWLSRLGARVGGENIGLLLAFVAVVLLFASLSPRFLSTATFESVAFQLPELGLLTLAMLMPIVSRRHQSCHYLHRQHLRPDPCLGAARQWRTECGHRSVRARFDPRLRSGHRKRPDHGAGDSLYRRASHPGVAFHDDLPARPRRIP